MATPVAICFPFCILFSSHPRRAKWRPYPGKQDVTLLAPIFSGAVAGCTHRLRDVVTVSKSRCHNGSTFPVSYRRTDSSAAAP